MIKEEHDLDSNELAKHEADYGTQGSPPPNLTEIRPKDLAHTPFAHYGPTLIEYRQFAFPGEQFWNGVHMYYYHDGSGVIIRPLNDCDPKFRQGGVRFYTFAKCVHELRELTAEESKQRGVVHWGRCYHVYACTKCDYVEAVDSSD